MLQTVLVTLPIGIGVAVNPLAIAAGIVLLGGDDPRGRGVPYLCGWLLGLAFLILASASVAGWQVTARGPETRFAVEIGRVAAGVVLVAVATWTLLHARGGAPAPPRWLGTLDAFGRGRAMGLGGFFAIASLKNLLLVAAAGAAMGASGLSLPALLLVAAAFLAVCAIGVLAPLLVRLRGGPDGAALLERWRARLLAHAATLTAATMLLLGVHLILSALAELR